MQSRVYFSETYNKKLFAKSLGKAFFVELFQNKNIKIINIKHLVNLYTFKREFSYFYFFIGLFNAIQDAIVEILEGFIYSSGEIKSESFSNRSTGFCWLKFVIIFSKNA